MRRRLEVAAAVLITVGGCGHGGSQTTTFPADAPPQALRHRPGDREVLSTYDGWNAIGIHDVTPGAGWRSRYVHLSAPVDDLAPLDDAQWVVAHGETGKLVLFDQGSTAGLHTIAQLDPAPLQVATGDLDGDGRRDIVAASHGEKPMLHLLYRGEDGFSAPLLAPLNPRGRFAPSVLLVDLDREGTLDVLAAVSSGDQGAVRDHLRVFRNTLHGRLADEWMAQVPAPRQLDAGDFDQDGLPDVLSTGPRGAWLQRSAGFGWLDAPSQLTRDEISAGKLWDIDRDGTLDLVLQHDAFVEIRRGVGAGRTAPPRRYPLPEGSSALVVIDLPEHTAMVSASGASKSFTEVLLPVGRSASRQSGT
jgi:hypothetical protein